MEENAICLAPLGIPHKRIVDKVFGDTVLPCSLNIPGILNARQTVKLQDGQVLLNMMPHLMPELQGFTLALIAFAEHRRPELFPASALATTSGPLCRELLERFVESSRPPRMDGKRRHCLTSMLPPWLLPDMKDVEKAIVITTDPRFLLMRTGHLYKRLHHWTNDSFAGVDELEDALFFFEAYFGGVHVAGEVMQKLSCWAREERRSPEKVKIFFLEDFLRDPDTSFKYMAQFLGASSESLDAAVTHFKAAKFFDSATDLAYVETQIEAFEQTMQGMPKKLQASWTEKIEMLASESEGLPRIAELCNCLQQHRLWSMLKWQVPHSLGVCKPCNFAYRSICRNFECPFCHEPHARPKRLSQKERRRQHRRQPAFDRTPSPEGSKNVQSPMALGYVMPTTAFMLVPVAVPMVMVPVTSVPFPTAEH
mmetsp:Transcript_11260/g.19979  ORF Transcript_11260/g.19979 Transcript_11260/m.19979 type:complete len:424 (+) Transcript_11260:43-1314(+)